MQALSILPYKGAEGAGRGTKVKITSIKTGATKGHTMQLWVRIETDAGIVGLGECVHGGHQAIAIKMDTCSSVMRSMGRGAAGQLFATLYDRFS